jgi:hypothetical protein
VLREFFRNRGAQLDYAYRDIADGTTTLPACIPIFFISPKTLAFDKIFS